MLVLSGSLVRVTAPGETDSRGRHTLSCGWLPVAGQLDQPAGDPVGNGAVVGDLGVAQPVGPAAGHDDGGVAALRVTSAANATGRLRLSPYGPGPPWRFGDDLPAVRVS